MFTPEKFEDFFLHYEGNPNQRAGLDMLYDDIAEADESLLDLGHPWVQKYREPYQAKPENYSNPLLPWKHFGQGDNGPDGWRQCQTSAIAMCLWYLKTPGISDDLDYLRYVRKYGDTTIAAVHESALKELAVKSYFSQDMIEEDIIDEINRGYPVAVGILHHGPAKAPTGGGHWIVIRGYTEDGMGWIVSDPEGELDMVNGGFVKRGVLAGDNLVYSKRNFLPRWQVSGSGGWGWRFS